jgi:hypothetical protein
MATISERLAYVLTFDTTSGIKSLENVGATADKELGKVDSKLDKLGGGMVKFGAGAMAAAGIVGAGLYKMAQSASDLGESVNAVNVTFGDSAKGILDLGEKAARAVGLSKTEFNGLAVQFANFAQTVAGPGGDVVATMDEMTTRAADFASVMNVDVAEAARLFQSGLAGETEPLKKYGIDLSAAAVNAHAMAVGIGTAGQALTEQEKIQARYSLLLESTSQMQGDFANTSDSAANAQRILKAELSNLSADIGAGVLPALTSVLSAVSSIVGVFSSLSPETQGMIGKFAMLGTGALALSGAVSFVTGKLILMRAQLITLATTIAAHPILAMAAVVASVAAAFLLLGKGGENAKEAIDDLAEAMRAAESDGEALREKLTTMVTDNDALRRAMLAAGVTTEQWASAVEAGGETLANFSSRVADGGKEIGLQKFELEGVKFAIEAAGGAYDAAIEKNQELARAVQNTSKPLWQVAVDTALAENATKSATAATEEAADGWQEWADELTEAAEKAQDNYDAMVDSAQEWAEGVRAQFDSGIEGMLEVDVTSEMTARQFIDAQNKKTGAAAAHEANLKTILERLRSEMVVTGQITDDEAVDMVASYAKMGDGATTMVKGVAGGEVPLAEAMNAYKMAVEVGGDGMVAGLDPVADGMGERMKRADRALQHQLAVAQFNANFKSKQVGTAIPDGVAEGVTKNQGTLNAAVVGMIDQALAAARSAAVIESPSKLFAEEVGQPIPQGIAEGIDEDASKITDALEKAIDDAVEASIARGKAAIDAAQDLFDGFFKGIDEQRAEADLRQGVIDAERNYNKVLGDSESSVDDIRRAKERLEDANYRLAKATVDQILVDEQSRDSWIKTAKAAGLTKAEIDGLIDAYMRLAQAKADAAAANDGIRAEADAANAVRKHFDEAVAAGLISKDQLNHLSTQGPESQIHIMKKYLNDLSVLFGQAPQYHSGGVAGAGKFGGDEVPAVLRRGEMVLTEGQQASVAQAMGASMTAADMTKAVADGMLLGWRRVEQMRRAS